ncbi:MAG: NifU family protein [Clostridiales Family XIII bacterium]|nr:NifU family protein [Clostridiales Family XIII bacterium]
MEDRIKAVLDEKVNPILEDHFGAAELSSYEDGIAYIRMTGACGTCPSAQFTLEDVVRAEIKAALPEVEDVRLDTSVSEDLIAMAKKILAEKHS